MKKEKLIRSKIINALNPRQWRRASSVGEAMHFLRAKVDEEWKEIVDAKFKDAYEYADLIEVLLAIGKMNGITAQQIKAAMKQKREAYGNFDANIILDLEGR